MKISQMISREDFYKINELTLKDYFSDAESEKNIYIYPNLNAIMTGRPSGKVRDYLYCEYSVRGNVLKRLAVKGYVWLCVHTGGMMSDRKIVIPNDFTDEMLIYPCNKKYRIFDFADNKVDVISKKGFPQQELEHEIAFRTRDILPDFVPRLLKADSAGYSETIIDGKPLARIKNGYDDYRKMAWDKLQQYAKETMQETCISGQEYAARLRAEIRNLITPKIKDETRLYQIVDSMCGEIEKLEQIKLTFSHGDLQPGNIWIENNTGNLFIIDWETWGERSVWYDEAVLFYGMRPQGVDVYLRCGQEKGKMATVLLEDLVFQLNELNNLPESFGENEFEQYMDTILISINK